MTGDSKGEFSRSDVADKMISLASKSGLSRSETKIIQFLLNQNKAQTAKHIADRTEIARTKIYHLLKNLEKKGIVQAVGKWPKEYKLRDTESTVRNILEIGLTKLQAEFKALSKNESQLKSLADELENIVRGRWPSGISASVYHETSPPSDGVRAIYGKFVENELRVKREYRAITATTIFNAPDDRIQTEIGRKWKELHKQRIMEDVNANYVCYLGGFEKYLGTNSLQVQLKAQLRELEKNLLELENLNIAFSDRQPWGSILIWDDWAAFLLSPRKEYPLAKPYKEGISIEGRAAVAILKEQFDRYFEGVVEANLIQFLRNSGDHLGKLTSDYAIEDIEKLSHEKKMKLLKESSLERIRKICI